MLFISKIQRRTFGNDRRSHSHEMILTFADDDHKILCNIFYNWTYDIACLDVKDAPVMRWDKLPGKIPTGGSKMAYLKKNAKWWMVLQRGCRNKRQCIKSDKLCGLAQYSSPCLQKSFECLHASVNFMLQKRFAVKQRFVGKFHLVTSKIQGTNSIYINLKYMKKIWHIVGNQYFSLQNSK